MQFAIKVPDNKTAQRQMINYVLH